MVGVSGFEPPTSWSQTMRASHCATPRVNKESIEYQLYLVKKGLNNSDRFFVEAYYILL
jgi:hypothetical protein